jgi:hypothetical protein
MRRPVDDLLYRFHERLERVPSRPRRARKRHHLGAQLTNHLLGRRQLRGGCSDVKSLEREIAGHQILVMAILAIGLDDAIERGHRNTPGSRLAIRRVDPGGPARLWARRWSTARRGSFGRGRNCAWGVASGRCSDGCGEGGGDYGDGRNH